MREETPSSVAWVLLYLTVLGCGKTKRTEAEASVTGVGGSFGSSGDTGTGASSRTTASNGRGGSSGSSGGSSGSSSGGSGGSPIEPNGAGGVSATAGATGEAGGSSEPGPWQLQQELPHSGAAQGYFGDSVALDGDTILIGGIGGELGGVYVFVRKGNAWSEQWSITPSEFMLADFGAAVALDGDTALIGAPAGAGRAFVYVREGDDWTFEQELLANDVEDGDQFGTSVALAGDTAFIGAPSHGGGGAAYVFVRSAEGWIEQERLLPPSPMAELSYQDYGELVALSGDTASVVGVEDFDAIFSNEAFFYVMEGSSWMLEHRQGYMSDVAAAEAIALSGDTALLPDYEPGKPFQNAPFGVWVLERSNGAWARQTEIRFPSVHDYPFGDRLALDGDVALIGTETSEENLEHSGAVYVYVREGDEFTMLQRLVSPRSQQWDSFGHALALDEDTLVVTAPGMIGEDAFGSVYVYTFRE